MEETKRAKKERRTGQVELLDRIKEIKTEHPYWGYRRITACLRHR